MVVNSNRAVLCKFNFRCCRLVKIGTACCSEFISSCSKVREQLNAIEGLVKELKNEDFNKSINTLIRMYDKHNAKITNLANARYELAKAKKNGADSAEIEKKQQAEDKALRAIMDIDDRDEQDLRKGIEKCTQVVLWVHLVLFGATDSSYFTICIAHFLSLIHI